MHSRASGPLVMLTRQPAEGRAREGGLRCHSSKYDIKNRASFMGEATQSNSGKLSREVSSPKRLYESQTWPRGKLVGIGTMTKIETILSQGPKLRDGSMDKVQRLDGCGQMRRVRRCLRYSPNPPVRV